MPGALSPVLTIGDHVLETLRAHQALPRRKARAAVVRLLAEVGIPEPDKSAHSFPHELSGGMCQRVGIALAICNQPLLLMADEPTSALDVVIQRQVMETITALVNDLNLSMILIGHDMGLMAQSVDRLAVMYAGSIVEQGPVGEMFRSPQHPYTRGLLRALPHFEAGRAERLQAIPGSPPDLRQVFSSCPFAPRCPEAVERCHLENPPSRVQAPGRSAACWLLEGR